MAKLNGVVRNWSYSALSQYEKCPAQYKYARIEKRPQPSAPALERGNAVHAQLEARLRPAPPPTSEHPAPHLSDYIEALAAQQPRVEEMWYLDSEWRLVQAGGKYPNGTWLIVKMDAYVAATKKGRSARRPKVVDWKTGRRYPDHEQQGQLYALASFAYEDQSALHEPADIIDVDMVYVDEEGDPIAEWEFDLSGAQGEALRENWTERAMRLFTETTWKATPSFKACNWCPFSGRKGGPCRAG